MGEDRLEREMLLHCVIMLEQLTWILLHLQKKILCVCVHMHMCVHVHARVYICVCAHSFPYAMAFFMSTSCISDIPLLQ